MRRDPGIHPDSAQGMDLRAMNVISGRERSPPLPPLRAARYDGTHGDPHTADQGTSADDDDQ